MTKAELKEKLTDIAIMKKNGLLSIEEAEEIMNKAIREYRICIRDMEKQIEANKQAHRIKWRLLLKATSEHGEIRRETKKK